MSRKPLLTTQTRPRLSPEAPLIDLLSRYESHLRTKGRRPRGIEKYLWTIRKIVTWLGPNARMADLDRAAVLDYIEDLADRGRKGSTIINDLAVIRSFANWAISRELRDDDPTTGIDRPQKSKPDPTPLYESEILALIATMGSPPPDLTSSAQWHWARNRRATLLWLYTGMRSSEAAALRWKHVRFDAKIIEVRDAKNGKDRRVPLHMRLEAVLNEVPEAEREPEQAIIGKRNGTPLHYRSMEHVCGRWLERLGFDIHAHQFRYTLGSHVVWNGGDIRGLQILLGHAQLSTTERYVKVDDRHARATVERMPDFGA